MPRFTEVPYFILDDYVTEVIGEVEFSEPTAAQSGILFRANSGMVTKNTNPFQLYKKSEGSDYQEVKASLTTNWNDKPDNLKLKRLFSKTLVPSDDILRTVIESAYQKITYDAFSNSDFLYDIENGDELYIRKDSLFSQWFKNHDDYKGFANPEKLFLFLGQGYKDADGFINIQHYAFKNWLLNALPENNRNETLDEFFYVIYDQLYHQVFEMQKNIFSLLDPYEIDPELIRNLSLIYNEEHLTSDINEIKIRTYVDNIINWLKKKGTYSALYTMWYILTKDTGNDLIIYDGWHTNLPSGSSPENYLEWYDYTKFYTSSSSADYPREYSLDTKVLSTHYKVEFCIENNPFGEEVLSEELMNDLYNKWERSRPVTRYARYHVDACLTTDFSGNFIPLYNNPIYDANVLSATLLFSEAASGAAIHVQTTAATEWVINHDLESSNVLTQVFDLNLNRIFPEKIEIFNSSTVRITFPTATAGSAFIVLADFVRTQNFILNNWTVDHLLNSKYVLSQFYSDEVVNVNETIATNSNTLDVQTVGLSGLGFVTRPDYTHTQNTLSNTWNINHNLGFIGVMLDIYDGDDKKIIPDTISLTDMNNCTLTFSTPVSGNAGIRSAGNPSLGGDIEGKFSGAFIIKLGNGEDLDSWDYSLENDIKNSFYTIDCSGGDDCFSNETEGIRITFSIPKGVEGYITEIGIFNDLGELSFVSKIDYLYKHNDVIIDVDYFAQFENL